MLLACAVPRQHVHAAKAALHQRRFTIKNLGEKKRLRGGGLLTAFKTKPTQWFIADFLIGSKSPPPQNAKTICELSAELMHPSALQSINKQLQQGHNCDLIA